LPPVITVYSVRLAKGSSFRNHRLLPQSPCTTQWKVDDLALSKLWRAFPARFSDGSGNIALPRVTP
jgi:hypothetical protein